MQSTITVPAMFPLKVGEVLKIKNANGKGVYAIHRVGQILTETRISRIFSSEYTKVGAKGQIGQSGN